MSEYADIPIIDGHVHSSYPAGIGNLVQVMGDNGLSGINIATTPAGGGRRISQNVVGALFKVEHPGKFYWFAGLHHFAPVVDRKKPDFAAQVRLMREMGCDGIKMIEGKPSEYKPIATPLNDALYDEFYGLLESEAIPLLFHVADPPRNWDPDECPQLTRDRGWFYGDGTFPTRQELYDQVDDFLARFPKLRVIFAHFYYIDDDIEKAEAFLTRSPSVSFDLTPGGGMYKSFTKLNEQWREFFIRHQDRIIFGTDNNGKKVPGDPEVFAVCRERINRIRAFLETREEIPDDPRPPHVGIELDRSILEKIYRTNFQRYAGVKPRPVNVPLAIQRCEELEKLVRGAEIDEKEKVLAVLSEARSRLEAASGDSEREPPELGDGNA